MIDALCTMRVGMPSARARRTMSVCVVALWQRCGFQILVSETNEAKLHEPIRIADDEKGNIFLIRIAQDLVALRLNHVAIGDDQLLSVELFLALSVSREPHVREHCIEPTNLSFWIMRMLVYASR